MTTSDYERNMVLSNTEYKVVGTRPVRHDGADKVTGRAIYGAISMRQGYCTAKYSEAHMLMQKYCQSTLQRPKI